MSTFVCPSCQRSFAEAGFCPYDGSALGSAVHPSDAAPLITARELSVHTSKTAVRTLTMPQFSSTIDTAPPGPPSHAAGTPTSRPSSTPMSAPSSAPMSTPPGAAPGTPSGKWDRCCDPQPPVQQQRERLGLGTEFGEQRYSAASYTRFVRAAGKPIAIAELRYNDRAGLGALGIAVAPAPDEEEIMLRETADPFPGDRFARPPGR